MRVEPEARWRDQAELLDLGMGDRGHFGGDHAAHRVTHDNRLSELELLHHVERMQGDVEHVAQTVLALRPAVARHERRDHAELRGERGEQRIVHHVTTRAMQEQEIAALAALRHLDARAGWLERDEARFHSAAALKASRSRIGWIQKRSSRLFQSGHRLRRCGITFSANRRVEWRTFSSGMSPTCLRQKTLPTRNVLISSSICWRTVSGEPATT